MTAGEVLAVVVAVAVPLVGGVLRLVVTVDRIAAKVRTIPCIQGGSCILAAGGDRGASFGFPVVARPAPRDAFGVLSDDIL